MLSDIRKVYRFIKIYGFVRTLIKVAGRKRPSIYYGWFLSILHPFKNGKKVGIIGSGHFPYATIAVFLKTSTNCNISWCCDIDYEAAKTMAVAYGIKNYTDNCEKYLSGTDLVYIASNHATHSQYAVRALKAGCDVYIEKPISTTWNQLKELIEIEKITSNRIFVGYNRPFSPHVLVVKKNIENHNLPFTLQCFITGHLIPEDHWYRNPNEGTRVCGNLGHWIDIAIHMLSWSGKQIDYVDIAISYSSTSTPSDNFSVVMTTPRGDLISLVISSRSEPFEGINESINFQQGNLIAKINDHRHTQIWVGEKYISRKSWPKDSGSMKAILQPFGANTENIRNWDELVLSTELMLVITDMVVNIETSKSYTFSLNTQK